MAIVDDALFQLVFHELTELTRFDQDSKNRNKSVTYKIDL